MSAELAKSIKEIAQGRSDLYRVSPYDLNVREGWNSRDERDPENIAHIDMLAQSIAEVGVKESLTVKFADGKLYLTDGHCRRAAAIMAIEKYGADKDMLVPVKTEARDASEADMVFSQIVRNSGKPLTPFEQGKVFKRLIELGWETINIARQAGFSKKHVDNLLTLHEAPEPLKEHVRKGEVSATMATQAIQKNRGDVEAAAADVDEAVKKAKAAGKEKATAKDLPIKPTVPTQREQKAANGNKKTKAKTKAKVKPKPIDPKKAVREMKAIVMGAEIAPEGDGAVALVIGAAEWARIKELLVIKEPKKSRDNNDVL